MLGLAMIQDYFKIVSVKKYNFTIMFGTIHIDYHEVPLKFIYLIYLTLKSINLFTVFQNKFVTACVEICYIIKI